MGWGGEGLHRDIDDGTCLQDQCGMSDHEMLGQLSALWTVTFIYFICVQLHTLRQCREISSFAEQKQILKQMFVA